MMMPSPPRRTSQLHSDRMLAPVATFALLVACSAGTAPIPAGASSSSSTSSGTTSSSSSSGGSSSSSSSSGASSSSSSGSTASGCHSSTDCTGQVCYASWQPLCGGAQIMNECNVDNDCLDAGAKKHCVHLCHNVCRTCTGDADCDSTFAPQTCNTTTGACNAKACSGDAACGGLPFTCSGGACTRKTCTSDTVCAGGFCVNGFCETALGQCKSPPP